MKKAILLFIFCLAGCHRSSAPEPLVAIQIQDRNGLTETISHPDRLLPYETVDFLSPQPYKKVLRVYKIEGKNNEKLTTYHPNGGIAQYLEAEAMRAHGAYREWHPNGQLKLEAQVIGGTADLAPGAQKDWLFDGLSQVWDDQGRLIAQIHYEKGTLEGPSLYFYPNGQLERELYFSKNVLEGEATEYNSQGHVKSQAHYKKGHKEGACTVFFEEGKMAYTEEYRDGLLLKGVYYNPKGDRVSEVENGGGFQAIYENNALTLSEYRMGKPDGIVKKFTPNGELHRSYFIKNGRKQGEEIEYYLNSELSPEVSQQQRLPKLSLFWRDNAIHGKVKTWYNTGKPQSEREYVRNKKQGPALAWYREGSLMMVEEYEADLLVKGQYFKLYYKEPVSTVNSGEGLATLFDEMGTFLRKVSYTKGKPVDTEE